MPVGGGGTAAPGLPDAVGWLVAGGELGRGVGVCPTSAIRTTIEPPMAMTSAPSAIQGRSVAFVTTPPPQLVPCPAQVAECTTAPHDASRA